MELNRDYIINKLKSTLSNKRFLHTLGVEETAIKLAKIYGVNEEKVMYAALLHDCAKDYSEEKLKELSIKYHLDLTSFDGYMQVLHSFIGAKIAQVEYNVEDKEIINAIKYHTTGRADMSIVEKIVFIADYIEPNRKEFDGLSMIRNLVLVDLDQAVLKTLNNTILYLKAQNKNIHPLTYEAREYLTTK